LEVFIWSGLSDAGRWSGGKLWGVLHFDFKAHVVYYIYEKHPLLGSKLSTLQLGLFVY
jgi:hypothetical protein